MSRPRGSKNTIKQPKGIVAEESERLEYLAALLLEIIEEELRESEAPSCNQN
ncbi:MAG: hypothetical protein WAW80_04260 [Candidatus Saccharimonadales bacterium]